MSYQDRYHRESENEPAGSFNWLLAGSVPLFAMAGIRFRLHVSMLLLMGLILLIAPHSDFGIEHRLTAVAFLFLITLVHQTAHCFAARGVGGYADEAVIWPLGGLADTQPPHRPAARFLGIAAGPLALAIIALSAAAALHFGYAIRAPLALNSGLIAPAELNAIQPAFYLWYLYVVSYVLLLLNLLPVLPLDGGHLLQSVLWAVYGYGKSMLAACNVGIVAAVAIGIAGAATGYWVLLFLMLGCLLHCVHRRSTLKAAGVQTFDDLLPHRRRHRLSRFMKWRARRQIRREAADQALLDNILEKVLHQGIDSLTWAERRVLRRATDRQRERAMEGIAE
jgi:stage IV sporulation protein FB